MTLPRLLLAAIVASLLLASPAAAGAPLPGADDFADAADVTSEVLDVDNTKATGEVGEPDHEGFTVPTGCDPDTDTSCNPSVWYRWTPPSSGVATIEVDCAFAFTSAVYTGTALNALTRVVDPANACTWAFNATGGQEYKIAFSGSGEPGATRTGSMVGSLALRPKPGNDDFPGATLGGSSGTFEGSNEDATGEPGEPDHAGTGYQASLEEGCDGAADSHHGCIRSLWWTWTAPAGGPASFDTCGSDYDTTLAVYTGSSVGGLTEVGSNDETENCGPDVGFGTTSGSRVGFDAVAGTTYRVAVAGYQGDILSAPAPFGNVSGSFTGPAAAPMVTPPLLPLPLVTPRPAPGDKTFAGASFSGSRTINLSGRRFAFRLRSPEDANVDVVATTSQAFAVQRRRRRKVRVGSARAALLANRTKTVRIRVSRKALRLLRSRGKLRTAIRVTGTDKAGNRRVTRRTVTLKLKRKKRRSRGRGAVARRSVAGG